MKLIKELNEKANSLSDTEIDKVNDDVGKLSSDEYFTMANERWSEEFTKKQIDKGEFDNFVKYAYDRYKN